MRAPSRLNRIRHPLPLALSIAAFILVVLLLASSGVRAVADTFLLAFREQPKISKLTVIIAPFPQPPAGQAVPDTAALGNLARLQVTGHSVAAVDDAQALLSFSVARIARFPRPSEVTVYQNTAATLVSQPQAIQRLLSSLGGQNAQAPAQALNSTLEAHVSEAVRLRWDTAGIALTYWQLRPPQLRTTSGPSIEQLRSQAIQAYFLIEPQVGQQLLNVQDWDHTVVIPVPPGTQQRTLRVDRQQATLIEGGSGSAPDSYLVWQKGGILNYMHAPVSGDALLRYAAGVGGD